MEMNQIYLLILSTAFSSVSAITKTGNVHIFAAIHSGLLGFWTLSIVWYSKKKKTTQKKTTFRKLDLFPSSGEEWETSTLFDPLERPNLSHWIAFRIYLQCYKWQI
jgi:hypothetical protein